MKLRSLFKKLSRPGACRDWLVQRRLRHISKFLHRLAGRREFQDFFEDLCQLSLLGMNIGGSSHLEDSGERSALTYVKQHLPSEGKLTIFDVGANVGHYTLLLHQCFGERAEIYSFEPSSKTFQKLSSNIEKKPGIALYNLGFGSENAKTTLFTDSDESALASIYKRKLDHFNVNMSQREEVEIRTIDAFCEEQKIERIHFLKLDVEGHEKKVFDGASKMLDSGSIDFIQFEFGGCHIDSKTYFQDFYYLLKDRYHLYRVVKDGLFQISRYKEMYEAFLTTNYLAERK